MTRTGLSVTRYYSVNGPGPAIYMTMCIADLAGSVWTDRRDQVNVVPAADFGKHRIAFAWRSLQGLQGDAISGLYPWRHRVAVSNHGYGFS